MSTVTAFLVLLIGLPVLLLLATKLAQDLDRRGLDGRPYALLVVLVLPVGLAVWLYLHLTLPVKDPTG